MKKLFLILLICNLFSCGEDDNNEPTDNFDRNAMLTHWADDIIIPGYTAFAVTTEQLQAASTAFAGEPTATALTDLRTAWETAYLSWQSVAMYDIGKAEEILLRNNLNIYPVAVTELEENVNSGSYNLELPSTIDQQGFPALDYLLFGLRADDAELLSLYQTEPAYAAYLQAVTERIHDLTTTVLSDWTTSYRDAFIANDGNSGTASVDRMVNDYIFYYEKHLRAGKVGIPAGVFSGSPLENTVEGYYRRNLSKTFALAALDAVQDFFNGKSLTSEPDGSSLAAYLQELNADKAGTPLDELINDQFDNVRSQITTLSDDFVEQIATDNTAMLATFDQLQLNVVNLKVDMLQVLNINVDYVDADGD